MSRGEQLHTVVILAAGSPPASLVTAFGKTSSAMLPVNGRPTIHWSLRYLQELGVRRAIIGVRQGDVRVRNFVGQVFGGSMRIEFVTPAEDRGPGLTLLHCLELADKDAPCVVVLGDTLFAFPEARSVEFEDSFVLLAAVPPDEASRWCLARADGSERVVELLDKAAANSDNLPALIGVYYLSETASARRSLAARAALPSADVQMRHALQPYIEARRLRGYLTEKWYDCGHFDRLVSSRRHLLAERAFNTITVDDLRGTITKRSARTEKFLNEINYYRLLPPSLSVFFPRCVDYSIKAGDAYITLEYYGYPTLSELWVFEELDARNWRAIFARLKQIIDAFGEYAVSLDPERCNEFYWGKTTRRLKQFAAHSDETASLVSATRLNLNGRTLDGWPALANYASLLPQRLGDELGLLPLLHRIRRARRGERRHNRHDRAGFPQAGSLRGLADGRAGAQLDTRGRHRAGHHRCG